MNRAQLCMAMDTEYYMQIYKGTCWRQGSAFGRHVPLKPNRCTLTEP